MKRTRGRRKQRGKQRREDKRSMGKAARHLAQQSGRKHSKIFKVNICSAATEASSKARCKTSETNHDKLPSKPCRLRKTDPIVPATLKVWNSGWFYKPVDHKWWQNLLQTKWTNVQMFLLIFGSFCDAFWLGLGVAQDLGVTSVTLRDGWMLVTAREVKIQKRHKKQSFQNFILARPDFLLKKDKYVANARKSQMSEYCSECLIQTYCNN